MARQSNSAASNLSFLGTALSLLKQTFQEWLQDKAPQLAAALAYYVVFSLAPLVLVLLAIVGVVFRDDPAGAWSKLTLQMSYFLDQSAVQIVQKIAETASQPGKSTIATIIGDCAGTLRRKRRLRSAPGCLEHNLGRKSHARSRSFGFSTEPLSFVCNGWRHLFSAACIAGDRSPA